MKYAQVIMGSAGTGKSTYCKAIQDHCATVGRSVRIINLDPAAEAFKYSVACDIRDLVSVDDVMTELNFGPNGALIYAMEYLMENIDWFKDQLDTFMEDDYILLDCPGQIELYSHVPVMKHVTSALQSAGFNVIGMYLLDSLFVTDAAKLIAGNLMALSAMLHLELPHLNVLTKCDLVDKTVLDRYLSPSGDDLVSELSRSVGPRYKQLNKAIAKLLDDYDMVSFFPLDITEEDSLQCLLLQVDNTLQYGEDMEPKEPVDEFDDLDEKREHLAAQAYRESEGEQDHDDNSGGHDDGAYGAFNRRGAGGSGDRDILESLGFMGIGGEGAGK